MRIAQIISGPRMNGAARHCAALTGALAARGHDLLLVARPRAWVAAHTAGGRVRCAESRLRPWHWSDLREAAAILRAHDIEVMHTHMSDAHLFGVQLSRVARIPVVATAHARFFQPHWAFNDRVIAVSEAVAAFQARWNRVPRRRMTVIHQFVDLRQFAPIDQRARCQIRESVGIDPGARIAAFVGNVFLEKGVRELVVAWAAVAARLPDAHLMIVGPGPAAFLRQVRATVAASGIADRVTLLGPRDDIHRLMGISDALVMPSWDEGAGLAAIEGMAAGAAVVATRVGGLPEYVRDGETGLLTAPRDARALGMALIRVLGDRAFCRAMGKAGRKRAESSFAQDVQVPKIEAVLRDASRKSSSIPCPPV